MRWRSRRSVRIGLLLVLVVPAAAIAAPRTIECPDGETRLEIEIDKLRIEYQGHAFTSTLGSLGFLAGRLSIDQKPLQEAAAATQQWNEFLKGLAAGYNSCAVTRAEYAEGLERIYPRLEQDAADLETIRKLLLEGREVNERRLEELLDSYLGQLRRFAEISGQAITVARIESIVQQQVGAGTEQILKRLDELERRLEETPLAAPEEVETVIGKKLRARAEEAEAAYQRGYELYQSFRFDQAVPYLERALAAVRLHDFYYALGNALMELPDLEGAETIYREGIALALEEAEKGHEAILRNQLGRILLSKGELGSALKNIETALAIDEKVYGAEHPIVAIRANNIGTILKAKGDLEGALEYTQRALAILESRFGAENPSTRIVAGNLEWLRAAVVRARED